MEFLLGGCCGAGGTLVWATEPWVLGVALAVALVVLLAAAWSGVRDARRAGELALLALALGGLLWMVAGPSWVQEGERTEPGRRVVLVDASRSMQVRDASGEHRGSEEQWVALHAVIAPPTCERTVNERCAVVAAW